MARVTAWMRPLKPVLSGDDAFQYFVKTPARWEMGSCYGEWKTHDLIVDFVGRDYGDDWEIERKRPFGKWAD